MYCDDLDFFLENPFGGYKIIYVPSAIAYHAKKLAVDGGWKPTGAEVYYSAEAAILLAYKWAQPDRVKYLCEVFSRGGESEKKAVKEFEKRKQEGRLPEVIDKTHKIGRFLGDEYCEMRFKFSK